MMIQHHDSVVFSKFTRVSIRTYSRICCLIFLRLFNYDLIEEALGLELCFQLRKESYDSARSSAMLGQFFCVSMANTLVQNLGRFVGDCKKFSKNQHN